jgi:hypothetical protein
MPMQERWAKQPFFKNYDGWQPVGLVKAAGVIIHITNLDEPPLRLLLNGDAVNAMEENDLNNLEVDKK